jgi:glycosyltransferase involved in cell wall biosynthesis
MVSRRLAWEAGSSMTVPISVYIPVWNESGWLPGAIESVLAQTHDAWELVIGDNASTEDLASVVAAFDDPRIRYHRWERHTDVSENFNRTLLLCCHDWINPLSADDRLHPECLRAISERIEAFDSKERRLAMVLTACERVRGDGVSGDDAYYRHQRVLDIADGVYDAASWLQVNARPGVSPWNIGSMAFSREVLAEAGSFFRPDVDMCSDFELALRIATYGDVAYIGERLLNYTVRGDSDMGGRALRNLRENARHTPIGIALMEALQAHEAMRPVSAEDRRAVLDMVARSHLQRAFQHRLYAEGHGRRGALLDVGRAAFRHPRTLVSPLRLGAAMLAVLGTRGMIEWSLDRLSGSRRTPSGLSTKAVPPASRPG